MINTKAIGVIAESLATEFLKNKGYEIVARNVNFKSYGELDIIALDKTTLVIVEVKFREISDYGHPIESITKSKIAKIRKCVEIYIENCSVDFNELRFDVVTILDEKIEHIEDAF